MNYVVGDIHGAYDSIMKTLLLYKAYADAVH